MKAEKENDILTELKDYFKNTPREKVLQDWEETRKKCEGINSPTIEEFLKVNPTPPIKGNNN